MFTNLHRLSLFLVLNLHLQHSVHAERPRQIWAWGTEHEIDVQLKQLQNSTWSNLIDGVQFLCGLEITEAGFLLNRTVWEKCSALIPVARASNTKVQLWISGKLPDTKDFAPFVEQAVKLRDELGIDGFSLDDEFNCAPRATLTDFESWITFHNGLARGLEEHGITFTSAIQAVFAIQDGVPDNDPCQRAPSDYEFEPRVSDLLATATLQKWLVMDTYYFTTGRFLGALDWHVRNIPLDTLAIGMMNRADLTENDLSARFYAIEKSGVDWINIFLLPIADEFLPFLQRWKSHCAGCGKQPILGCYDWLIECDEQVQAEAIAGGAIQ